VVADPIRKRGRRSGTVALLLLALGFLAVGAGRTHQVLSTEVEDFGVPTYERIPDWQMIIDTTFSGVIRDGAELYSTYDRSQPRSKKKCPT